MGYHFFSKVSGSEVEKNQSQAKVAGGGNPLGTEAFASLQMRLSASIKRKGLTFCDTYTKPVWCLWLFLRFFWNEQQQQQQQQTQQQQTQTAKRPIQPNRKYVCECILTVARDFGDRSSAAKWKMLHPMELLGENHQGVLNQWHSSSHVHVCSTRQGTNKTQETYNKITCFIGFMVIHWSVGDSILSSVPSVANQQTMCNLEYILLPEIGCK